MGTWFESYYSTKWKSKHRTPLLWSKYPMCLTNCMHLLWFMELCTYQENGQLEFIIQHHSVNTAGSVEPGCDFIHEVCVEDKEDNARAWCRREGRRVGLEALNRESSNVQKHVNCSRVRKLHQLKSIKCHERLLFTFRLRLWLESKLQGEIGSLTEPVASEREDGLQQHQAGLKVGSDSFLHNAWQSEWEKHSGRCRKMSRWAAMSLSWSTVWHFAGSICPHSHAEMVLDEVVHEQIVAQLCKIHGRVLVFGKNVAVTTILQQEAHHVCVSSLARLLGRTDDPWTRKPMRNVYIPAL